ncbi:MAG: hypothetical protein M3O87_04830 [Candidatus Dormibacteraeota bacterium]|nr:hypothetical protein [Candidatus Dormibacteraeota bacterium]
MKDDFYDEDGAEGDDADLDDEAYFGSDEDEADQYRPPRWRGLLVKGVALTLIIGLLLAFPLGYLLDSELRDGRIEVAILVTEITLMVALVIVVRSTRRRW